MLFPPARPFRLSAAFTPAPGYEAVELYSSAGTYMTCGGLSLYDGVLYFGQFNQIKSLDPATGVDAVVGPLPSNAGNALVEVNPADGSVYTAYGTSYSKPYIHEMGPVDAGGFTEQLAMGGIYDAAVNSAGELFISANPDVDGDDEPDGSRILRYDWSSGATTEIAAIGGSTGGLAFDADDNLYYSVYDANQVVKFTAAQVDAGGLTIADAAGSLNLAGPGFLAFDDAGNLFATNLDTFLDDPCGPVRFRGRREDRRRCGRRRQAGRLGRHALHNRHRLGNLLQHDPSGQGRPGTGNRFAATARRDGALHWTPLDL